ncbi:MAG: PhzF family phenazine biosynthesis protein [Arthrobacter sp.]|jgi:PhzF family phenazine biosynthesis protein|nr:PhzF family phenazine biosynthesis protein [Arthrobacter sp.]
MVNRSYAEVDVFSVEPYFGNPLAVVLESEGLGTEAMQRFAKWTNLSETTFLLPPTQPGADYRVRIFTGTQEFPFAGHPTLGSAAAWLRAGGVPARDGVVIQECGAGLVPVRVDGERLAFKAPPLTRYEPLTEELLVRIAAALGVPRERLLDASWIVNGPPWIGVRLASAAEVLALDPDPVALGELCVGVVGPHAPGAEAEVEVRAFVGEDPVFEDPVTGSLNAGLAHWLLDTGVMSGGYVAAQGTAIGFRGRVHLSVDDDGEIWVGGDVTSCVSGTVEL